MYEIHKLEIKDPVPGTKYRVRCYIDNESSEADKDRPVGEPPKPNSGLVLEVIMEDVWELKPLALCPVPPTIAPTVVDPPAGIWMDYKPII